MCFLIVGQKFGDEMSLHDTHFRSEGNRWIRYWEEKYATGSNDSKPIKKLKKIETLNVTDKDCYPNIYKILEISCISPLVSTEAKRAASEIKRLKIAYRSTMTEEREGNLNLIQLQGMVEFDTIIVGNIFIKSRKRSLMHDLPQASFLKFSLVYLFQKREV